MHRQPIELFPFHSVKVLNLVINKEDRWISQLVTFSSVEKLFVPFNSSSNLWYANQDTSQNILRMHWPIFMQTNHCCVTFSPAAWEQATTVDRRSASCRLDPPLLWLSALMESRVAWSGTPPSTIKSTKTSANSIIRPVTYMHTS